MDLETVEKVSTFVDEHTLLIITILAWSLIWKGIALWQAARLSMKGWFISILILNTVGILEIVFVSFIASKYKVEVEEVKNDDVSAQE